MLKNKQIYSKTLICLPVLLCFHINPAVSISAIPAANDMLYHSITLLHPTIEQQ